MYVTRDDDHSQDLILLLLHEGKFLTGIKFFRVTTKCDSKTTIIATPGTRCMLAVVSASLRFPRTDLCNKLCVNELDIYALCNILLL